MRFLLFLCGISILALGGAAVRALERADGFGFLQGSLALGGGLIICGFFATRWYWHGLMGAAVLSLLGAARGLINLPAFFKYLTNGQEGGPKPVLETAVTLTCILLLVAVVKTLLAEKHRRLMEEGEEEEDA